MKQMKRMMTVVTMGLLLLGGVAEAKGKPKMAVSGIVNLNTATAAQLDLLPGVGAKVAKRIIEQRTKAPFTHVEDLAKVKGFGKKKVERLKMYLSLTGPTTLSAKKIAGEAAQGRSAPPAKR